MQGTIEHSERSSELFVMAEHFGIPLTESGSISLPPDSFHQFCNWYVTWSKTRDAALRNYLTSKPKMFRCYLPYSDRVYRLASEVVWYLDELIVRDPLPPSIAIFLSQGGEAHAGTVLRNLRMLWHFREVIDSGYILLMGDPELVAIPDDVDTIKALSELPEVKAALDSAVRIGLDHRPNSKGEMSPIFQQNLDSGGVMGWKFPGTLEVGMSGPRLRVGEILPAATPEMLVEALGDSAWGVRRLYPREVARTVRAADTAVTLNAAALFDRPVDDVILNATEKEHNNRPSAAQAMGARLVLPYLEGIPPTRLLDLRERIPNSFLDFRSTISEIVLQAMRDEPEQGLAVARSKLEAAVSRGINQLEKEFDSVSRKTRLEGYGAIIPAFGVLAGSMIGIGSIEALSAATVLGVGIAVRAAAESAKGRTAAKANPFYFIWEANKRA